MDHLDLYSNALYVLEDRGPDLAFLAQKCHMKDQYRLETSCVLANHFSKSGMYLFMPSYLLWKGDGEKAIMYLERVLKLDPNYHNAWTLLGHEYVEIGDTHSAVACYRHATAGNPSDYRAWYALGQAYQILGMPLFALQYFKTAAVANPSDSRMWVGLGNSYGAVKEWELAIKTYKRALVVIDNEVGAIYLTLVD
jgi:anaphase-promoting complex subunit 8